MGTIGHKHKNQLFQRKSKHAVEPEVPSKNTMGEEKGGGVVHLSE